VISSFDQNGKSTCRHLRLYAGRGRGAVRLISARGVQRRQLWDRFVQFMGEMMDCGLVDAILVDGSFVTAKAEPCDIDGADRQREP
jgi:hypothetical protein